MIRTGASTRSFEHRASAWPKAALAGAMFVLLVACTPTVKVATDEPITINLNVNIKHEILVKVDKELDDLFADDELF
jgi:cation transport ATPase